MRQLQTRINLNYRPLSKLSMVLKIMPSSYKGHKYILWMIDKVANYLITVPICQSKSEEIGDALIKNFITKILHTRIHNNRPSQYIYVLTHELYI